MEQPRMSEAAQPRLTGGTLMTLLCNARPAGRSRRTQLDGQVDQRNNRELLKALISVADPDFHSPPESTFKQNTSDYKACKVSHGDNLPFDQPTFVDEFDRTVRLHYASALERMSKFVDNFVDTNQKGSWLVRSLLGLIAKDVNIGDDAQIFATPSGLPITKRELAKQTEVCVDALLLGCWHYVVTSAPNNTLGRATFEHWHDKPSSQGARWKLDVSRVPSLQGSLNVVRPPRDTANTDNDSVDAEDCVEAELLEDDQPADSSRQGGPSHRPEPPRIVFNQFGSGGTQIAHANNVYTGGCK